MKGALWDAVSLLDWELREVMEDRLDGDTLKAIADRLGVRIDICLRRSRAISCLHAPLSRCVKSWKALRTKPRGQPAAIRRKRRSR